MNEAWELVRLLLLLTGGAALWLVMLLAMFGVVLIVLTQTIKAVKEIRKKNSKKKVANCEVKKLDGIKLRDCPYCGEKASLLYMVRNKKWVVKCWNIRGCRVQPGTREMDTPEEAAEIWNRRAVDGTTKIYGSSRKFKTEPVTSKH